MISVLENMILLSVTPLGFMALMLSLIFGEYLIVKSIMKDMGFANITKISTKADTRTRKIQVKIHQ